MKTKILIVEDEIALSDAYELILTSKGYETAVAYDGSEALKKVKTFKPELILLDLRLPRIGGIEFLEQYELKKLHPDVKVIVFSNLDSQKEIDAAYNLGAERYILKAWASPNELVKLVNDTLKKDV